MSRQQDLKERISDVIAEAANQEYCPNLGDELKDMVSDLPPDQRENAINDAFIYVISVSQPGYMSDSVSYASSGEDVRKLLLYELETSEDAVDDADPDYDAIMEEFDSIRKDIKDADEAALRKGASVNLPINQVIEVSTMSCGEWLDLSGLWPELEDGDEGEDQDEGMRQ